jgi:DNA-directed RNA polymerase subunit K
MNKVIEKKDFTKYEKTRIIGARALQISMDAPLLTEIGADILEGFNYDSMKIANEEFEREVLPITVRIKRVIEKDEERQVTEGEIGDEREISEEGEIMELATPEDEDEGIGEVGGREGSEELQ